MLIRIGLIQMICEKNSVQDNINKMFSIIDTAISKDIDILVFPEMNITGYTNPIKYPNTKISLNGPEIKQLLDYTKNLPLKIITGIIEHNEPNKPYITQLVIERGQIITFYRKITIVDEEVEWFSPGNSITTLNINNVNSGLTICADIENEGLFKMYAEKNTKIIFESAAPGLYGSQETRNWQEGFDWWRGECIKNFGSYAKKFNLWICVATQAGRTVDEDFPGGSYVFAPTGDLLFETPDWKDYKVYLEVDLDKNIVKVI